jgi:hypothetical protein
VRRKSYKVYEGDRGDDSFFLKTCVVHLELGRQINLYQPPDPAARMQSKLAFAILSLLISESLASKKSSRLSRLCQPL